MTHAPARGPRMSAQQIRQYPLAPARRYRGGLDPADVRRLQDGAADTVEWLENAVKNAHLFPAAEVAKRDATRIYRDGLRARDQLVIDGQARHREMTADAQARCEEMITAARNRVDEILAEAAARWPSADREAFTEVMISVLGSVMQTLEQSRPGRDAVLAQADGSFGSPSRG